MDILLAVLGFVVAVGIIVVFHEYGHYLAARLCGVQVGRFSVGFGRPILRMKAKNSATEWCLAPIPLGGYVQLLDERIAKVPQELRHCAFNNKPLAAKLFIAVAGPAANFVLAFLLYAIIHMLGFYDYTAKIGEIRTESLAHQSGLLEGDVIHTIDGELVNGWKQASLRLLEPALGGENVVLGIERGGTMQYITLNFGVYQLFQEKKSLMEQIGFVSWVPKIETVINKVEKGSPAWNANLRRGQKIIAFDYQPVDDWFHFVQTIRAAGGQGSVLTILENGQRFDVEVRLEVRQEKGREVGRLGVSPLVDPAIFEKYRIWYRLGFLDAVREAFGDTILAIKLTFQFVYGMIVGGISVKNLSGPVGIADIVGDSLLLGLIAFLSTLAVLSISIGVLNLLPIPMLDGGNSVVYMIEAIKGSALSPLAERVFQGTGLAVIALLISVALFNDIVYLSL